MYFEINPNNNNHGKWDLSKFVVEKLIPTVDMWPYPLDELMLMAGSVVFLKPDIIIEWGTNQGRSTRIWLETIKHWGYKTHIHTVDLPPDVAHPENPQSSIGLFYKQVSDHSKYVTQHLGDGLDVTKNLVDSNPNKEILFFIDGDHHEDSVRREIQGLLHLHLPKYNLLFHDAYLSRRKDYYCGVFKAIDDLLLQNKSLSIPNKTFINTGLPGMYFLQVIK
jgi:hypothetical protein